MNIVLVGIQGSGKGTLLEGLTKQFDFTVFSVGQLLREEVATGSELGKRIKKKQDAGELVETSIVMDALNKALKNSSSKNAIFDGFPRNSEQAQELDKLLKVDLLIHLNLTKEVAYERILNRLTCNRCGFISKKSENLKGCPKCGGNLVSRSDDTLESINARFKTYENETYPLLERYRARGVVVDVDANRTPSEVLKDVLKVLNEYNNKK